MLSTAKLLDTDVAIQKGNSATPVRMFPLLLALALAVLLAPGGTVGALVYLARVGRQARGPAKYQRQANADSDSKYSGAAAEAIAAMPDAVLDVLRRQEVSRLRLPAGNKRLKAAPRKALLKRNHDVLVIAIHSTESRVQR